MTDIETVDWESLYDSSTTVLEGDFNVVVTEAVAGLASDGKKKQIKVTVRITDGAFAGRTVKSQFTMSPENPTAMKIFFLNLGALGIDKAYFGQQPRPTMQDIARDILGRRVTVELAKRTWNGIESENIKNWKPLEGGDFGSSFQDLPAAVELPTPVAARREVSTPAPDDPFAI